MRSLPAIDSGAQRVDPTVLQNKSLASRRQIIGLTLGGVASSLLTTAFGIFHVETFLTAYRLPLPSYATGSAVYAIFNTANDVGGAWAVDSFASRYGGDRSHMVGLGGCVFAICFLAPFFRWGPSDSTKGGGSLYDTAHFVISLSLYDTMYSFMAILLGSIVTDNSDLTEAARIRILFVGKLSNVVASFTVARVGLAVFDVDNLAPFRVFAVVLSILVAFFFMLSHRLLSQHLPQPFPLSGQYSPQKISKTVKKLKLWQVVRDFMQHSNFRAWIVMEMLLESQANFAGSFQKTFVDNLLQGATTSSQPMSRETCDLLLSCLRPLSQICCLISYVPIQKVGYRVVYKRGIQANLLLALFMLIVGTPSSKVLVASFVVLNTIILSAMQTGFHLAMSDMVVEMKLNQARERRFDEPSLAGLFMGANALVCKPMDSFLPIVAAKWLGNSGFKGDASEQHAITTESEWTLFYLLIGPALVFSAVQLHAWRKYSLNEKRVQEMRIELKSLRRENLGENTDDTRALLEV